MPRREPGGAGAARDPGDEPCGEPGHQVSCHPEESPSRHSVATEFVSNFRRLASASSHLRHAENPADAEIPAADPVAAVKRHPAVLFFRLLMENYFLFNH